LEKIVRGGADRVQEFRGSDFSGEGDENI